MDEEFVRSKYPSKGGENFKDICTTEEKELYGVVMEEIKSLSKTNKLNGFETVKAIYIDYQTEGGFTNENGLLTPTFKLKRQQLRDYYEKQIKEMYRSIAMKQSSNQNSKL